MRRGKVGFEPGDYVLNIFLLRISAYFYPRIFLYTSICSSLHFFFRMFGTQGGHDVMEGLRNQSLRY